MAVVEMQTTLFIGWTVAELYSTLVLWIPLRRGERWTWYASWNLVLGFPSPILFQQTFFVAVYYFGTAVMMALALLLTRPAFTQTGSGI